MDQGAHFHQCDFQVHSPRDTNWNGKRPTNEEERKAYSERFVAACRERGLHAVAITDHHDFAFFNHIKAAAHDERDDNGSELPESQRLVVFPGMELSLGVPCQALLILAHYQTMQRKRALDKDIARDELEAESLQQQIDALRKTLSGLSEDDRQLLSQHDMVLAEEQMISAWGRELDRLEQSVRRVAQELSAIPRSIPAVSKFHHVELVGSIEAKVRSIVNVAKGHIDAAVTLLSAASEPIGELNELRRQWRAKQEAHNSQYEAVKQRASSQETQLKQIGIAEERLKVVRGLIAENKEKLAGFGKPEEAYQQAKRNWVEVYKRRGELLRQKCEEMTALSRGRIRASIRRGAGTDAAQARLTAALAGTNIRGRKIEELFGQIGKTDYPAAEWERVLTELEELARWGASDSSPSTMPTAPLLAAVGFSEKEMERVARKLSVDEWLEMSLIELADVPRFEYQQREKTYIEFREASAGQQATALLRVLLNQEGPPLSIDQPEDDLDNQVILEIVQELWKAKMKRQIIFSSHNANLVVNGDADLVVICGYRTLSDQSLGMIEDQGAIDIERIRGKITTIMEGGKEAFQMRRDKYGF